MLRYVTIIALLYFGTSAMAHDSGAEFVAKEKACQKKLSTKVPRGFMKREALINDLPGGDDMATWSAAEVEEYYRAGSRPADVTHTPHPNWEHPLPGGFRPNWPPAEKP